MTYRLRALRDWALRLVTFLAVAVGSCVAGLIPGALVALLTYRLGLAPIVWAWPAIAVLVIVWLALVYFGAKWRKGWLWRRFYISVD
jgi:hypothetical protein